MTDEPYKTAYELEALIIKTFEQEKRIAQLEKRLRVSELIIDAAIFNCASIHHEKQEYHAWNEECKPMARVEAFRNGEE